MKARPPVPICKTFLTCRRIFTDPRFGDTCLEGIRSHYQSHRFPFAITTNAFIQLVSAHGDYQVELQVQTPEGQVVWKEGPPNSFSLTDPLQVYEFRFEINLMFPEPGPYNLVLVTNGDEVGRERFIAKQSE